MNRITTLKPNQVFVFGSNLAGIHGAGAARDARKLFGAEIGVGKGFTGQCYAIPTKRVPSVNLSLAQVEKHVKQFLIHAARSPSLDFLLTPIGCGLAGFTPEQIAPMFRHAPDNVILPPEFVEAIERYENRGE